MLITNNIYDVYLPLEIIFCCSYYADYQYIKHLPNILVY